MTDKLKYQLKNVLSNEKSLYLLQHATNPIQWQIWNKETLKIAEELDRPILVSIGYAACHWCHVMEKETFEDELVASFMNDHFINIKIDREERPDLDQIYMDALQVLTGSGGWPLNIFLTPGGKPFYGGTYFPPKRTHQRPSWIETLQFIDEIWKNKRSEVVNQAERLTEHLRTSGRFLFENKIQTGSIESVFNTKYFDELSVKILSRADFINGGFGTAPKFPQLSSIQLLLNLHHYTGDENSLRHALHSLKKMLTGGIYDQLGGGISRYSTDDHWLVPHFEKMLYDNSMLIGVLSDAYQISKDDLFKNAIEEVIDFCLRELKAPQGGFYTSIDADSEGEEGKFYVWTKNQLDQILQEKKELLNEWFGVTEKGNWEGVNILISKVNPNEFADLNSINTIDLFSLIKEGKKLLMDQREKRLRPLTDTKILLNNNALLISSFCKAAAALQNDHYSQLAVELFEFIKEKMFRNETLLHSLSDEENPQSAFLDDYSYLIRACLHLQEVTGKENYLYVAKKLTQYVVGNFLDKESGFFFYCDQSVSDIILRKIDIYDSPVPSGNSVMIENLLYLSVVFNDYDWKSLAENMLLKIADGIRQFPESLSNWGCTALSFMHQPTEIVITGFDTEVQRKKALAIYIPNKILISAEKETELILTKNKDYNQKALIYLCKNNQCYRPVPDFKDISDFHSGLTFSEIKIE